VQTIFGHYDVVTCIARSECNVSQDCYVVTGSKDCTVMVWHWSTKQQRILGDNGSTFSVHFNASHAFLVCHHQSSTSILPVQHYVKFKVTSPLQGHLTVLKSCSLSRSWRLWRRVRCLKQCRFQVVVELQQRWCRTNSGPVSVCVCLCLSACLPA